MAMTADCPACGSDDSVDYPASWDPMGGRPAPYCACEVCGARFEVEEDADWDGERYVDCSGPGELIGYETEERAR